MVVSNVLKNSILSLIILLSFSSSFSQNNSLSKVSFEKGKTEAAENIKNKKYIFKAWGLPSSSIYPWQTADEIYNSILKDKYKITFEWIGGCMVDEETVQYAAGYNEAIESAIEAEYGIGILEKVRKQAEAEYESKYGEKQREFDRKFEEGLKSFKPLPESLKLPELIKLKP